MATIVAHRGEAAERSDEETAGQSFVASPQQSLSSSRTAFVVDAAVGHTMNDNVVAPGAATTRSPFTDGEPTPTVSSRANHPEPLSEGARLQ